MKKIFFRSFPQSETMQDIAEGVHQSSVCQERPEVWHFPGHLRTRVAWHPGADQEGKRPGHAGRTGKPTL